MDFLWDDEYEEDVFVQPKIKKEKVVESKQEQATIKDEKVADYKRLVKEYIFAKDEVPIKEENIESTPSPKKFDISLQTPIVTSINRYTVLYSIFTQKRRNQLGEYAIRKQM